MKPLLVRNVELDGRIVDLAIVGERIAAIGIGLRGEELFDARGGGALPGLHDHHLHLLATAADYASVHLHDCHGVDDVAVRLRQADATLPASKWLRATGYHEYGGALLDRAALDAIVPDRPVRIQHQTGSLWLFNSRAIAAIGGDTRSLKIASDAGHLRRGDSWLAGRLAPEPPDLAPLGRDLAAYGITGVCDATVSTDADRAALLADAIRTATLPIRLMLMSGGVLDRPEDGAFAVGPVKIVLDDDRLPPVESIVATIRQARAWKRNVAAHCVTAGELAVMIAALEEAGALPGDRIEHGNIIPEAAIAALRALHLTVVAQPGFIHARGDRYRALVAADEQPDLFRAASLRVRGVAMAGSSDAPYGPLDPWLAMRSAQERRTAAGRRFGIDERLSPRAALDLFLTPLGAPAGERRHIARGAYADLCILAAPIAEQLARPDAANVALTLRAGRETYRKR